MRQRADRRVVPITPKKPERYVPTLRSAAHSCRMADKPRFPATTIAFVAEPFGPGTKWRVIATLPTGQKEQVGEFKNEAEAVAWIGSPRCWAWIKLQGYG
jgi:hypothetical protein